MESYTRKRHYRIVPNHYFSSVCIQSNVASPLAQCVLPLGQSPDLVGVVVSAFPDLHDGSVSKVSVGEVEALA